MQKRTFKKRVSLFLALCLILTGLPSAPVMADAAEAPVTEATDAATIEQIPRYDPEGDCKVLSYVHREVFSRADHIARLEEEESLFSYVFLNRDGTRTAYYLDEAVKFRSADGQILEKDLSLTAEKGGFRTTQNDIGLHLPANPASGVRLTYNSRQVTLLPQGGSGTGLSDGKAVRYEDYYGQGMDLVYTPTMDGVKEEIILSAYSGVNSFTFLLNTGGLNLYQSGSRYFLAESKLSDSKIWLGALEIFDAAIKPGTGTMTAVTVMPGQQYRITLTVDEAFLTDPDTLYPVTVDPTLEVSDSTHGAGAIEDAPVYEGSPTSNFGSYQYNRAGYAGTSLKRGRTAVRLTGLLNDSAYQEVTTEQINSVKFYMSEASGTSGVTVNIHPLSASYTWTESSITWNKATAYDSASWASAAPSGGAFAEFDITNLAKCWKNGLYHNGQNGFLMIGASEATVDKSLCSSEFATASKRPYVEVIYSGLINYTYLELDKGGSTKTLRLNDVEGTVTWKSSSTTVATVDSTGKVTPKQIGTATITATAEDGTTATCTVRVKFANGVYKFSNTQSGLLMHTQSAGIADGTNVIQAGTYSSGLNKLAQCWRLTYIGNARYSIRPVHMPSLGLYAETGNVKLVDIGSGNTLEEIDDNAEWTIAYISSSMQYRVRRGGLENRTLRPNNDSTSSGISLIASTWTSTNAACHWKITPVNDLAEQILLYDTQTGKPAATDFAAHVKPGQTLTPAQLGLKAVYVNPSTASQTLTWNSSASTKVSVHSVSGNVTGVTNKSTVTITISKYGSNVAPKSFTVYCSPYWINLEVMYDEAYLERYPNAVNRIKGNLGTLRSKYFNEFGIFVDFNSPTNFTSLADECVNSGCSPDKDTLCNAGECANATYDSDTRVITRQEYHHKNINNIMLDMLDSPVPLVETSAKAVFIGHEVCKMGLDEFYLISHIEQPSYGQCYDQLGILAVYNFGSVAAETQTTVHEVGHLFGVTDHYGGPCPSTNDMNSGLDEPIYSEFCIYGEQRNTESVTNYLTICDGCRATITENADRYSS